MLPVVDRPAIDYVVREAAAAGLDDILFVQGHGKIRDRQLLRPRPELEAALAQKGDEHQLAEVVGLTRLATIHSVRQQQTLGLGHAIATAEQHIGHEPFAVLLGDDLIDERDPPSVA